MPFDPDAAMTEGGIFGLPHSPEEAAVVLIPVPWEATVSWGTGTADAPEAILAASRQIDLVDHDLGRPYEHGIAMLPIPAEIRANSDAARRAAEPVLEAGAPGDDPKLQAAASEVNRLGAETNRWVAATAAEWLDRGKIVGLVGGDHSTPFGLIQETARRHPGMGILQIDAHADLRDAYEGFTWSHASIMYNVMNQVPEVARIVQVGLRDVAPGEDALIRENPDRLRGFYDPPMRRRLLSGETWRSLTEEIVATLPRTVYVSFDIDGLDPVLCPNTGTPVPGGLSFAEVTMLLVHITETGRRIVGFDVNEVAPDRTRSNPWDENVGARMVYKLCGLALLTRDVPTPSLSR